MVTKTSNLFKCRTNIIILYIIIKQKLINALNTRLRKFMHQIVRLKTFWLAASLSVIISFLLTTYIAQRTDVADSSYCFFFLRRYYTARWRGCAQLRAQPLVLHHTTDIGQSYATRKPYDVAPVRSCGLKDWSLVRGGGFGIYYGETNHKQTLTLH